MYRRKRTRKNGNVWVGYYYEDSSGKERPLGTDLDLARIKWAELQAKEKPADLRIMRSIFDRHVRDVLPGKAPRTQSDNLKELKQPRKVLDDAPIDALTPAMIAQYRDARKAKVRANREIATLSHVFNMAREWGLTANQNPCQGVRKNKETPRDFYVRDEVWNAIYRVAAPDLRDAMDLAYLTAQRPGDVLIAREADILDGFLLVAQGKTSKKLRIRLEIGAEPTALGELITRLCRQRRERHLLGPYLITTVDGRRLTAAMLRIRFDEARKRAADAAREVLDDQLATAVRQFQFRDIRPKAATEIADIREASALLGHSDERITETVYRRVGEVVKPTR